jgi:prolyl 4-hydroxylase
VNNIKFPTTEDLNGAAIALMRLQDVYRLEPRDIANGHIKGAADADSLNAHDCYELGRTAYNQADYYHTIMWMQEALNRLEHEQPPSIAESEVLEYLAFSLYQQGNIKRALHMTKRLVELGE